MTEPTPPLVVFGIDREGKPRAARFGERDTELATKAAALLGFRTAWITDERGRAIAEALPTGNVFARGNGSSGSLPSTSFVRLSTELSPQRQRRRRSDER
jgi:hypothetical protein